MPHPAPPLPSAAPQAKFTVGSINRHIGVMTASGTVGLLALFVVDLLDLFFLGMLGDMNILAALGFAGSVLYFLLALNIGLSIGAGAVVSQQIGAGDRAATQRIVTHILIISAIASLPLVAVAIGFGPTLLAQLGAEGQVNTIAQRYLTLVGLGMPVLALAMACGGILRAQGDARGSMVITLVGALVNAALDPIFIFGCGWGVTGAAIATLISRFAMLGAGLWLLGRRDGLIATPQWRALLSDARDFFQVAAPAVLTNLSSPIGVAFVTSIMARFGDDAVAGNSVVIRVQQVAFCGLFALSGAVGPIAGQNLGAGRIARIRETLNKSLVFCAGYTLIAAALLALAAEVIVRGFNAERDAAALIRFFCYGYSLTYVFNGVTYVTNAMFNNLRVAHYATQFNFAKATLGTVPFAYAGAALGGPFGVYAGVGLGAGITALAGAWVAYWHLRRLARGHERSRPAPAGV